MKVNKNVEKAIRVLEESIKCSEAIYDMYAKKGDKESCRAYSMEIIGMQFAINLLTDKKVLDDMCENYEVE